MLHVKEIEKYVDDGECDAAHTALNDLLEFGPNNTAALKLRARLYEFEGRFAEEAKIWDKVARIDNEDSDAVDFLIRKQLEDREHFYFTDDIAGGGRRYLAYPRNLISGSAFGLLGCLAFLASIRMGATYPILNEPLGMLTIFGLFVVLPTIYVMFTFIRSLKSVTVSHKGLDVFTRMGGHSIKWTDIERFCLARSEKNGYGVLSMVLVPKDKTHHFVEINLTPSTSAVKARTYMVGEVARAFSEPEHVTRESLALKDFPLKNY